LYSDDEVEEHIEDVKRKIKKTFEKYKKDFVASNSVLSSNSVEDGINFDNSRG
jgi:hypothetical protein